MDSIDRQNKEFDAVTALAEAWKTLRQIAVVDDDYPIYRSRYEGAVYRMLQAMKENKRQYGMTPEMPGDLTFAALRETNLARCKRWHGEAGVNHWSMSDWCTATTGELGEAANVVKKLNRYRDGLTGNNKSQAELEEQLAEEIADTVIYLDLWAARAGIDLASAVRRKYNLVSVRNGFPERL